MQSVANGLIHPLVMSNLRRFQRGERVQFRMDRQRYLLSA